MKFSMAKMMAAMAFVSVVLAAAFAMPSRIGWIVLTLISLLFLPQFIWVGALNTKGRIRAFFIGAILSGVPHFLYSVYFLYWISIEFDVDALTSSDGGLLWANVLHLVGFVVGFFGGLGGVFAHWFIVPKQARTKDEVSQEEVVGKLQSDRWPAEKTADRIESPSLAKVPK